MTVVDRIIFRPPSAKAGRSVRSFSARCSAAGSGSAGITHRPAGTRYAQANAAESASATHSAARPQKAWPRAKTGSFPGNDRSLIPVPEAERSRRTVSDTEAPAGTDTETRLSQRSRPREKATAVTVPSGAVLQNTSDTRPEARQEFSRMTDSVFVFIS